MAMTAGELKLNKLKNSGKVVFSPDFFPFVSNLNF